MPSYTFQFWSAVAVMLASGILLAMQGVGYDKLGIGPLGEAWLSVLAPVLAIIAGLLPQVQRTPLARSQAYTATAATGLVPDDVEPASELMVKTEDEELRGYTESNAERIHREARERGRPLQPRPPTGVEIKRRERAEPPPVISEEWLESDVRLTPPPAVSEPVRRRRVRREDEDDR